MGLGHNGEFLAGRGVFIDHHLGELLHLRIRTFLQCQLAGFHLGDAGGGGSVDEVLWTDLVGRLGRGCQRQCGKQREHQVVRIAKHGRFLRFCASRSVEGEGKGKFKENCRGPGGENSSNLTTVSALTTPECP
ncbi:hypothetical protein FQZ97_1073320 [compost metagenome]